MLRFTIYIEFSQDVSIWVGFCSFLLSLFSLRKLRIVVAVSSGAAFAICSSNIELLRYWF